MCHIYASTDPDLYRYVTRSVRLHGFVTSLRLEQRFWDILDEMAREENMTTPRFLARLHDEVEGLRGEVGNFASMLRVVCTAYLTRRLTESDEAQESGQARRLG